MTKFMVNRVLQAIATLWAVSLLIFILPRLTGNAADALVPNPFEATAEQREAIVKNLGLDQPIYVQYVRFTGDLFTADFGQSFRNRLPVRPQLFEHLKNSIYLGTVSLFVAFLMSVPLGVASALTRGTIWDRGIMMIPIGGQSIPSFWAAILLIIVFSIWLNWLPAQSLDPSNPKDYVMPSLVLGWGISAGITRLIRSSMLEVLNSEFVKLARAKGVGEMSVVFKHALRNALIPVVTFLGLTYGLILAGAIATETVFSWPGMGRMAYLGVFNRDFPMLQAATIGWATLIIVANLIVDLLYGILDPRIRVTS